MSYDTGYTSFYRMKLESSWGTAVTPDVDIGLLDATGNITQDQGVTENFGTGSRKNNQLTYGAYKVNGSLTGKIQSGKLLAYALGTDTPSGSAPTTHTLAVSDGALSSFSLGQYYKTTDKGQVVTGCKINDVNITLDKNGILTGTYNWVGKSSSPVTSTVGSREALTSLSNKLLPSYAGTISWNASEIECRSFAFNYNNNLGQEEVSIGDRRVQAITEGQININGTFVLVFSSQTVYDDFQSSWSAGTEVGTTRALSLVASTGSTSTLNELSLGLTNVSLHNINEAVALSNERIVAEYSWTATALGTTTWKDQLSTTYIA